jgi:enoyl-CoA hydratase/carnithine racemase
METTRELITVAERDDVVIVGLNDPEKHNAFSITLVEELHRTLMSAANAGARKFVFHGHGPSFSSGANMDEYLQELDEIRSYNAQRFYESEYKLMDIARLLRRPTIQSVAAVHGWCIGLGAEMAFVCDFIVASRDATFWLPENAAGWNAGMGTTNRLTSTIGQGWARRMLLLGDKLPAPQAEESGLVARLCEPEKILDEALAVFERLSRASPLASQFQKRLLDILPNVAVDDSMDLEVLCGFWLAHTRDVREAAQAFVERRKPAFTGT